MAIVTQAVYDAFRRMIIAEGGTSADLKAVREWLDAMPGEVATISAGGGVTLALSNIANDSVVSGANAKAALETTAAAAATAASAAATAQTAAGTASTAAATASTAAGTAQTTANAAMPKAGGTFTGLVVLSADGTLALHPISKQQLDVLDARVATIEAANATPANALAAPDGSLLVAPDGSQLAYP